MEKPTRICFLTTISLTIKSFLLDFSHYLVANSNFDITFICSPDEQLMDYCNDRIHYIPLEIKRGISFDGIKVIRKLTKIFRKNSYDIIQYSTPNAALYASIAAKKAKCVNRLYCQWGIRYMGFDKGLKRTLFKAVERITCNNSTIIESESYSLLKFSLEEGLYNNEKASVVWNGSACGVNLSKYLISKKDYWRKAKREELKINNDAIVFGYAGRITKDKGANELLSAFRKLFEVSSPNVYLMLVGQFDNENSVDLDLRNWAESSKNVIFVDWTDCIEQYYSAMDVFVSLSYREGFGLVVIEAAAMGLPSIVTDVPGQIDTVVVGKDGWVVKAKNIDDVVETFKRCINNPEDIRLFGLNARKKAELEYDQTILFSKLLEKRNKYLEASYFKGR